MLAAEQTKMDRLNITNGREIMDILTALMMYTFPLRTTLLMYAFFIISFYEFQDRTGNGETRMAEREVLGVSLVLRVELWRLVIKLLLVTLNLSSTDVSFPLSR